MKKILFVAIACAIGASACSGTREPTDAQLGTLLRSERADPADAKAQIDALAVECLRAWSDDKELLNNLPMRSAGETGRKSCRARIDGWIADPTRNPDKLTFAEISTPKSVRMAMGLQSARNVASPGNAVEMPNDQQRIPAALTRPTSAPAGAYVAPVSNIDLGAASMPMQQAESLCEQASRAIAGGNTNPRIVSYAKFCATSLPKMRSSMEQFSQAGNTRAMESLAQSAENMANAARDALAESPSQ